MLQAKAQTGEPRPSDSRFDSIEQAFGVLREAIGAFSNLSSLLRSPKVGGKALDAMVPAMLEGRDAVTAALGFIEERLVSDEAVRFAVTGLFAFVREERERLGRALDRASRGLHTARERLAFETEVGAIMPSFRASSLLLRLLVTARAGLVTDLDLREAIEQALLASQRSEHLGRPRISVSVALPETPCTLQANPVVLMSFVTIALALVHRGSEKSPSLFGECTPSGSFRLVASERSIEGDHFSFYLPELAGPVVPCLEAAGRLVGIEVRISEGEREVELLLPNCG